MSSEPIPTPLTDADRNRIGWTVHRQNDAYRMGRMNSDQQRAEWETLAADLMAAARADERERIEAVLVEQLRATLVVLYVDKGFHEAKRATDRVLPSILKPIRAALAQPADTEARRVTACNLDRATSPTYGHSAAIQAATQAAAEKLAAEVAVMQAERGAA